MNKEIWKDIEGYEGLYQVSNFGNVKSLITNKIIKPSPNTYGYLNLCLFKNGRKKQITVHKLVAEAFIPNIENKPTVNHEDGNKNNNCVDNLSWATYSEQIKHAYDHNLRKKPYGKCNNMYGKYGNKHHRSKKVYQYNLNGNFIKEWQNAYEIKRELGYSQGEINKCCLNKKNSAYNYLWKYKEVVRDE